MQEAFIRAYGALDRYHEDDRFGAWMFAIAVNECRAAAARQRRRERVLVLDAEAVAAAGEEEHATADAAWREEIDRALARLAPLLREAFVLRHVEDLSYEEMQAMTGAAPSALKMRSSGPATPCRNCSRRCAVAETQDRDEPLPSALRPAVDAMRELPAPDAVAVARVMAGVRAAAAAPPAAPPRTSWWRHPAGLATIAAAALVAVVLVPRRAATPVRLDAPAVPGAAATDANAPRPVRFTITAPGAHEVALVGDFNRWDRRTMALERGADGRTWTLTVQLPPGRYTYAFVADGTRWLVDPDAALAPDDGFGRPSSVLLLGQDRAT